MFDISVALTSCTVAIESKCIGLPVKSHKSQYDGANEDVFSRYAEQIWIECCLLLIRSGNWQFEKVILRMPEAL